MQPADSAQGTRISSRNLDPVAFWHVGAQIVALNWQVSFALLVRCLAAGQMSSLLGSLPHKLSHRTELRPSTSAQHRPLRRLGCVGSLTAVLTARSQTATCSSRRHRTVIRNVKSASSSSAPAISASPATSRPESASSPTSPSSSPSARGPSRSARTRSSASKATCPRARRLCGGRRSRSTTTTSRYSSCASSCASNRSERG